MQDLRHSETTSLEGGVLRNVYRCSYAESLTMGSLACRKRPHRKFGLDLQTSVISEYDWPCSAPQALENLPQLHASVDSARSTYVHTVWHWHRRDQQDMSDGR